uniref:Uncharacterized protein n=1 Tax=Siphoviridae sp. ctj0M16 TaxID=2827918 RepID=A0A8S5S6Y1_9CAUD|nr:MAG TPA: hypothetical protein [Siphoviridae sp. ctj0M16]
MIEISRRPITRFSQRVSFLLELIRLLPKQALRRLVMHHHRERSFYADFAKTILHQ